MGSLTISIFGTKKVRKMTGGMNLSSESVFERDKSLDTKNMTVLIKYLGESAINTIDPLLGWSKSEQNRKKINIKRNYFQS